MVTVGTIEGSGLRHMNLGRGNIQFSPQHKLNGCSYYGDSTPTFSTWDSPFHHLYVPYSPNNQTLAVIVNQDTLNLPSTKHFCTIIYLVAQMVKYLPAMQETRVRSPVWENPLEKGMATHCSILAWKIPWTEEPSRLWSMGLQRVERDQATNTFFQQSTFDNTATKSSFLEAQLKSH